MPKYVYLCELCDASWELFRSVVDRDAEALCDQCGQSCTRQLYPSSNIGIIPGAVVKQIDRVHAGARSAHRVLTTMAATGL